MLRSGRSQRQSDRGPRGGFTLIEAIMSMAITALIFGALTSLLIVAGNSSPNDSSGVSGMVKARAALDVLAADLRFATSITELSSRAMELSLPDRDGDGDDDVVRYEWSGVSGAPLLRSYACSEADPFDTPSRVIGAVRSLSFLPDIRTTTETVTTPATSGSATTAEALLASYTSTSSLSRFNLSSSTWPGMTFVPTLPANATTYRITKVSIYARKTGTLGSFRVNLTNASGNVPTSTVLFSQLVQESSLPSAYGWYDVPFGGSPSLSPTGRFAITVSWVSDSRPAQIRFRSSGASTANGRYSRTTNSGSSWTASTSGAMLYRVYGVADLPGTSTPAMTSTVTTSTLAGVTVRAAPSVRGAGLIDTYFPTSNSPDAP